MNNTRKSPILELLNKVGMEALTSVLAEQAEEAKNKFFATLTPMKREAYKIVFLAILKERDDLQEANSNWAKLFIDFHDEMITKLKLNYAKASNEVIINYGFDYVASEFITDTRDLEEIIDATAGAYKDALIEKEEQEQALKEKLHAQLEEVAKTLHLLTSESEAEVKVFEIETEQGMFNIQLGTEEAECDCGNCNSEEKDFEELLKRILK